MTPQGDSGDDQKLRETITNRKLLACLPRWIISSRTPFSAFLSKTFHIPRSGVCPASAVFPVPIPEVGLFGQQETPRLSSKKWRSLIHKRVLHIAVIALNYLQNGANPVALSLLGRRPTSVHNAIYRRLRSLLTACDRPGDHPLPPGRSGFEFIARIVELEHFASPNEAFNYDLYACASDSNVKSATLGRITDANRFKTSEKFSPIHPYRSLIADRLKLSGKGDWPLDEHLYDNLWLPFLGPLVHRHFNKIDWEGPDFSKEDKDETLKLVRLWDSRGLLMLFHQEYGDGLACRVFNAHKNDEVDRQIGDRRWINGAELHPTGPSAFLPAGPNMTSLSCPCTCKLVGAASDRKDFYHQAKVSRQRGHSNILPFEFEASLFEDSSAFKELLDEVGRPKDRETDGDRYGLGPRSVLCRDDVKTVWAGFGSLFQGDHLGVEYALSSHTSLLKDAGLLAEESHVLRGRPFPKGPLWEALVIDDYVMISKERPNTSADDAVSSKMLAMAEATYSRHGVIGSDDKTIRGAEAFKVLGAEIFSDERARGCGVITVGAPLSKRLPMIALSLKLATSPIISKALAAQLAGNWTSIFMFRRPFSCILDGIYSLGTKATEESDEVIPLCRKTADELVLASIFGLFALTDIAAAYDPKIYATDASLAKGAVTSKEVGDKISETLWLGGDRKGAYVMLDNPARQRLRGLGVDVDAEPVVEDFPKPCKSLDFRFDAVEICGGSGVLSAALSKKGLLVCTPIDLSASPHFNLENTKLVDWIFQMIHEKRFKAVICEPVCRTFSPAQHPASRSYAQPLGFNRKDRKTYIGNFIAFRCLAILWFCWRESVISLLEQPRLSKMAWLSIWRYLLSLGFEEAFVDSCFFGSPHRKPFRFLGHGLPVQEMSRRCPGGHTHVRIEGKFTKESAVYHPALAEFLADHISRAILASQEETAPEPVALESVICNDILTQPDWKTESVWSWKQPGHINVFESRSLVGLFKKLVTDGGDRRFVALLDSRVAKGAHGKGRSSSLALRPSLMRGAAYLVAGNLHPAYGFAPTRINTADAPARSRPLPEASENSILDFLSQSQIATLHSHQFSRGLAGWIRLYILVSFCLGPVDGFWICNHNCSFDFSSDILNCHPTWILIAAALFTHLLARAWTSSLASSLGKLHNPKIGLRCLILFVAFAAIFTSAEAMPLVPTGREEVARAARRSGNVLQPDRVVLQPTRNRRDVLVSAFESWLAENWRSTLHEMLDKAAFDCEEINEALIAYGKSLYEAGKSYGKFSETINAITQRKPILRRRVQAVWDLAFNWIIDEPHEHHTALPLSLMIACVTLSLLWGWVREAGIIALMWTGVLRVGEVISATRGDLILPEDAAPGFSGVLLRIRLPKTRGRAARHQTAKVEPVDIVFLLSCAFGGLSDGEMLWPLSPSTLRKRFFQLLAALGISEDVKGNMPYTLSSLRPGGATYWLQLTEDAEFVRRKGRWLSTRVLEIYLQEAVFATYHSKLSCVTKSRVTDLCKNFPEILEKAAFFKRSNFPFSLWPKLW